jgi:hypothetical protein
MRKENQAAAQEFMMIVQNAIDQYHKATGVLPIKNSELDTPLYEKYVIDFKKLKERGYISSIPANAFEHGGTSIYVIVDPETKPTIKLMDVLAFQKAAEMQQMVDEYKSKYGQLPVGKEISTHFYEIDYKKLNSKPAQVPSVYTRQLLLPLLVTDSGKVAIDYAQELMRLIDKKSLASQLDAKTDLRSLLVAESYYIPARSFPYHWVQGSPVPVYP